MMTKQVLLQFAILSALVYCVAAIPGGLNDEKQADEEVKNVVKNVHKNIEEMAGEEYKSIEPISYRKQVVAGANYFVKARATAKDGSQSHIHLRIYKPFRGDMILSAIKKNQDKEGPLEYFQ